MYRHWSTGIYDARMQVVLTVMEQAVGEEWTDEMQEGWQLLWDTACARMMDVIRVGEQHGPVIEAMWAKVCIH